jgi:type IV fimbrial biogenesis protein FimT
MCRGKSSGISLLEFSMSLVLLAAAFLLSAPLYYKVVDNSRVTAQANRLVATLHYARAQAVIRSLPVSVCSSSDGRHCTDTPWEGGYIAFVDDGVAGVVDSNDRILKRQEMQAPAVTITLADRNHVRFNPSGGLLAGSHTGKARSEEAYLAGLSRWLRRMSPVSSAYAASDIESLDADVRRGGDSRLSGVFTVCAKRVGRTISISLLGRISTDIAGCSRG